MKVLLSVLFYLASWERRKSVFPLCHLSSPVLGVFSDIESWHHSWQQNATADNHVSVILIFIGLTLAQNTRAHCPLQVCSVSGRQLAGILQGSA